MSSRNNFFQEIFQILNRSTCKISKKQQKKELAEKLGTKQAYIAELERGRKNITFSTITKYARACGKKIAVTLL